MIPSVLMLLGFAAGPVVTVDIPLENGYVLTRDDQVAGGRKWAVPFLQVTLGPFYAVNVGSADPTTQARLVTGAVAIANDVKIQAAAHVVGLFICSVTARTAGTAIAKVRINGTGVSFDSDSVLLNATNTISDSSMVKPKDGIAVSAGDTVGVEFLSDGSWAPTSADVNAWVVVIYD